MVIHHYLNISRLRLNGWHFKDDNFYGIYQTKCKIYWSTFHWKLSKRFNWEWVSINRTGGKPLSDEMMVLFTNASQITSLTIVYSTVYSGVDQTKHQRSVSLAPCGEFLAQMASNAENVSIWWRHHVYASLGPEFTASHFNPTINAVKTTSISGRK